MEKNIEFFTNADGRVFFYAQDGESKQLKIDNRNIIDYLYKMIEVIYPSTMQALQEEYNSSSRNYYLFRYKIVERFVRCNFGENDLLKWDIEHGTMHFEQVRCPLRSICKKEGVICNPSSARTKETEVAQLYANGLSLQEIAETLNKSECTVNAQLFNLKKKLNLNSSRELIKIFTEWE